MPNKLERFYMVVGSSMKPFFMPGTLVEIENVKEKLLRIGDVVCLLKNPNEAVRLHRIRKIVLGPKGKRLFKIKGDNLPNYDGLFSIKQIVGVAVAKQTAGGTYSFSFKDRYLGLFFAPFFYEFRRLVRKLITSFMPIIFPFLELKKLNFGNKKAEEVEIFWNSIKIASSKNYKGRVWIHPWFLNTKVREMLQ
jgi:signal peptidase I